MILAIPLSIFGLLLIGASALRTRAAPARHPIPGVIR